VTDKAFKSTVSEVRKSPRTLKQLGLTESVGFSSNSSKDNATSIAGSASSSSNGNNFSSGKITGISVGVVLGVVILAISLAAFFLWGARNRRNGKGSSQGSRTKRDKGRDEGSSVVPPYEHFSLGDTGRLPEYPELDGDSAGAKLASNQRYELP
jgi:hypothetical protein